MSRFRLFLIVSIFVYMFVRLFVILAASKLISVVWARDSTILILVILLLISVRTSILGQKKKVEDPPCIADMLNILYILLCRITIVGSGLPLPNPNLGLPFVFTLLCFSAIYNV